MRLVLKYYQLFTDISYNRAVLQPEHGITPHLDTLGPSFVRWKIAYAGVAQW